MVHLWLAWELPAGRAPGGSPPPLEVTLRPVAVTPVRSTMAAEQEASDAWREPDPAVTAIPPARIGARERPLRREGDDRNETAEGRSPPHSTPVIYYSARQLDHYPALLAPLAIRYPERAPAQGRAGCALVMVTIDAAGRVGDATVVEAEPAGLFEEAARDALRAATFSPGRRNGVPVRSRVSIRIQFDAGGAISAAP